MLIRHPQNILYLDKKKITRLLDKSVFKIVTSKNISSNAQIFNYRFVDKVKHAGIDKAYKKSWLVVQAYNNQEKDLVQK